MTTSNILLQYMESRLRSDSAISEPGPVITISREVGCPAKLIAEKLITVFKKEYSNSPKWQHLSNEILEESALTLKVDPKHIKHIFTYNDRKMLNEILAATSKERRYKSDRAIKKAIKDVISSIGEKGHYIIIGRGGVIHTKHINKSLHIRLVAPEEWRIQKIIEHKKISYEKASIKVRNGDQNRHQFLSYYLGGNCLSDQFDITINCNTFSLTECVSLIKNAYDTKILSKKSDKILTR